MIDEFTEVLIYGYGDHRYVEIPTYTEKSSLKDSLKVIKEFLNTLSEEEKHGYYFEVRANGKSIYMYYYKANQQSELEFNEEFKDLEQFVSF